MIECSIAAIATAVFSVFFIRAKDIPPPEPTSATSHLTDRKTAIHESLRDLQFDFRTGKLSEADYRAGKLSLQSELAAVLLQIRDATPSRKTSCVCGTTFSSPMKFCGNCGKRIL